MFALKKKTDEVGFINNPDFTNWDSIDDMKSWNMIVATNNNKPTFELYINGELVDDNYTRFCEGRAIAEAKMNTRYWDKNE